MVIVIDAAKTQWLVISFLIQSSLEVERCSNDIVCLLLYPYAGYGHITPETPLGQICTVVYCFFGLPISMLTLKTLGELVSKMVNKLLFITS